jgi:group I intron endonuclease
MGTVYVLRNKITGKTYVGQTKKQIEKRLKQHFGRTQYIDRALKKHGIDSFDIEAEENIPDDLLNFIEVSMIESYGSFSPNGYNLTKGGGIYDTLSNHPNREEITKKLSESHMGKKGYWTGKHRDREMMERMWALSRKKQTPEFIKKRSDGMIGHSVSIETRHKLSLAFAIPISQFSKSGELVKSWKSGQQIKRELGFESGHISQVCNGKRKTAYGFVWQFSA